MKSIIHAIFIQIKKSIVLPPLKFLIYCIKFDLKIKIKFVLGLVAIEFGFEYRFTNCKSSILIEFEIYNNFENCLAVGANTRYVVFLK